MTTQTEANASPKEAALKLALEALENLEEHLPFDWAFDELQSLAGKDEYRKDLAKARSLIPVIYEALAQPEQEPVAKVCHDLDGHIGWNPKLTQLPDEGTLLYTTPPQRTWERPWVSLTDDEIEMIVENKRAAHWEFVRQVEAKLKEKNT